MNNFLIETEDTLLIQKKEEELIKKNKFQDAEISSFDIEETPLENALEALDTYGFLSNKKVIIIKNIEVLNYNDNKKDLDHLFKYLDNSSPDNLLVFESKKLDNKTKTAKELKKKTAGVIREVLNKLEEE